MAIELGYQIDEAMLGDRFHLRRQLQSLRKRDKRDDHYHRDVEKLRARLEQSVARRRARQALKPRLEWDESLPITAHRAEVAAAIQRHRVLVVCGETGSGKSTQLPKICLELGRGVDGMIGHTQPRRLAARSIAARLADEVGGSLGGMVGYKVRFGDATGPQTLIKLMTDGILLAETQQDRFLEQYDTIILDEAHERSLNIDFLLGYLKRLLERRDSLRLIITSATIDAERFAEHFRVDDQPAPVLEVSGRSYPVDVRYRPLEADEDGGQEPDEQDGIVAAVSELMEEGPGDILVFLPTEREIRDTAKVLRARRSQWNRREAEAEILPLYARLSVSEQNRVFQASGRRRIVLATNVAESSLTVPGIRYVVDTGTARISRYAARTKVQRLPVERVSRASADQRAGRCGRVGPGICIRLFSEDDYLARDAFTTPEIRRTNLAAVILQTVSLRLGAIDEFPFVDPPRSEAIRDGYRTLMEIGALDAHRDLTDVGRRLSRLPVDPRIGRMILAGHDNQCLHEVLIIAAALEIQDPRERPVERQQAADQAHARHGHPDSDFLTLLNVWDFFHHLGSQLSRNQLRKACKENFLSYVRMREWQDVYRQLRDLVKEGNMPVHSRKNEPDPIHRALLVGLLSNVAYRTDNVEYTGAGGNKFHLWPGSSIFEKRPKWVMAAELVETSRRYLRNAARIQPEWIEPLAGHLLKRSYSEPHWSDRSEAVMAYERVTLFGLIIVPRRRVAYGPIDPQAARQLFIRQGLVEGRIKRKLDFLQHNQRVRDEIENLGAKARQRDYLIDDATLWEYYEQRIPEGVYDLPTLQKWLREASPKDPQLLRMQRHDLLPAESDEVAREQFPDHLQVDQLRLNLDYHYQPGEQRDGVTVTVPKEAFNQLRGDQLDWLVPGLVEEKITALIRSLPKGIRRNFVPAPETARRVAGELPFGSGAFVSAVAEALSRIAGETIYPDSFHPEKLAHHLKMNVRVVDQRGKTLGSGRDLEELRKKLRLEPATDRPAAIDDARWARDKLTRFDLEDFPPQVTLRRGGVELPAYPALVDTGEGVNLRLLDRRETAERETRRGLRRLLVLQERKELKRQVEHFPRLGEMRIQSSGLADSSQLQEHMQLLIAARALGDSYPFPRNPEQCRDLFRKAARHLTSAADEVVRLLTPLLKSYQQTRLALEARCPQNWQESLDDLRSQLQQLTQPGFLLETPWDWLSHYPRYLQAMEARLNKLGHGGLKRDQQAMTQLHPHQQLLETLRQEAAADLNRDDVVQYRWMLEEFRVSLFAQELGTAITISAKRLEKQWDAIRRAG